MGYGTNAKSDVLFANIHGTGGNGVVDGHTYVGDDGRRRKWNFFKDCWCVGKDAPAYMTSTDIEANPERVSDKTQFRRDSSVGGT